MFPECPLLVGIEKKVLNLPCSIGHYRGRVFHQRIRFVAETDDELDEELDLDFAALCAS
jgi:hypothetical protein